MSDAHLVQILAQGVAVWNQWVQENPSVKPDLSGANLSGQDLRGVDLTAADLTDADFSGAYLSGAALGDTDLSHASFRNAKLLGTDLSFSYGPGVDLTGASLRGASLDQGKFTAATLDRANLYRASLRGSLLLHTTFREARLNRAIFQGAQLSGSDLSDAKLYEADLSEANLSRAILSRVNLRRANLRRADLTSADLSHADLGGVVLEQATMVETKLEDTNLSGCTIYGIAAWGLVGVPKAQSNLLITPIEKGDARTIAVDDLEVAQFVYLLTNHAKLRNVLSAIMERGVLILGRFRDRGIEVLQSIAADLRTQGYRPIIFTFDSPEGRTTTDTVKVLVGLSRFVIVDLSGPSVPQELQAAVPDFEVPFVPILEHGKEYPSMIKDFARKDWFLKPLIRFKSKEHLRAMIPSKIIARAEAKHSQLLRRGQRAEQQFDPDAGRVRSNAKPRY